MGAGGVGLVKVVGGSAGDVGAPGDFFEIADEFFATGMDEEARIAGLVRDAGVDAIDAIADVGVDVVLMIRGREGAAPAFEEILDEGPIGIDGGGAALIAGSVAKDFDGDGGEAVTLRKKVGLHAFQEFLARERSGGVGFDDDFLEDVDVFAIFLREHHAHRVDVEIDAPVDGQHAVVFNGLDMGFAIEIGIGAMFADAAEFGFELLAKGIGIEFVGDGREFLSRDDAALGGGELKGGPLGMGLGEFEKIEHVIAAFGGGEEKRAAFAIGQSGAEDFGPGFGFDEREFIDDEEIEAVAAEGAGADDAVELDGRAVCELNDVGGFIGAFDPEGFSEIFQAGPGDAFGLFFLRGDIPDALIGAGGGGAHDFGERELGFAEAAASDDDAKTGRRFVDGELGFVQRHVGFAVRGDV